MKSPISAAKTSTAIALSAAVALSSSLPLDAGASATQAPLRWAAEVGMITPVSGFSTGATLTEYRPLRAQPSPLEVQFGGEQGVAFKSISMFERADRPCALDLEFALIDPAASAPKAPTRKCAAGDGGDGKFAKLPAGSVIRGVQLCSNDDPKNHRMKGIRVFAMKFDAVGNPQDGGTVSFERPSCKKWEPAAMCPAGQIATAIRAYFLDDSLTGMGLECRFVWSEATAPKDWGVTATAAAVTADTSGNYKVPITLTVRSNSGKSENFFHLGLMSSISNPTDSTAFSIAPKGTYAATVSMSAPKAKFEAEFDKIPGCTPGTGCLVPMQWDLGRADAYYRTWNRPSGGTLLVKMTRPKP